MNYKWKVTLNEFNGKNDKTIAVNFNTAGTCFL